MRTICRAALILALLSPPAYARKEAPPLSPPPMPTGYADPGPKPKDVLSAIFGNLRRTMKDPYSIRDVIMCEPQVVQPFLPPGGLEWWRSYWKVDFALNAKNSYGGYAGSTHFTATFNDGKLERVSSPNLGPELNAKLLALVQDCQRVTDADVQRLLQ